MKFIRSFVLRRSISVIAILYSYLFRTMKWHRSIHFMVAIRGLLKIKASSPKAAPSDMIAISY